MPNPGQANNPGGINSFSGPLGQKEPAYGQIERDKALESAAPVGSPSPDSVAKRAQRRAVRGGGGDHGSAPSTVLHPDAQAAANPQLQQQMFWQAVLMSPESSPLAQQFARQALGQ